MGFTKLDERILQSSIMAESAVTFKVWIALLAACRENGIAYVSSVYLSTICHLSLARVDDALQKLESPDEHSRSLNDDGRRIRRIDGGYEVINYAVYRDFSLKDAEAERKRLYRQRLKRCPDVVPTCPDASASASASFTASLKEKNFLTWWEKYPRKVEKTPAFEAYVSALKGCAPGDLDRALDGYLADIAENKTEKKYIKHAATFLHKNRWRDYLDRPAKVKKIITVIQRDGTFEKVEVEE